MTCIFLGDDERLSLKVSNPIANKLMIFGGDIIKSDIKASGPTERNSLTNALSRTGDESNTLLNGHVDGVLM